MRILVVEDDRNLAPFLVRALEEAGHAAVNAPSLAGARERLREERFDLVSLDLSLPDGPGLPFLRELRAAGAAYPVLLLTSRAAVGDRVEGLDAGADDYLVKPFALEEYLGRVRALLRRASSGGGDGGTVLRLGTVECDERTLRVRVAGRAVDLTPRELALLREFLRAPGAALARTILVNRVWNYAFDGYSNVVDVHVSSLRRKLAGGGVRFRAVPRVGYALEEEAGPGGGPGP
jgi:two-component system OmpR family response regulator